MKTVLTVTAGIALCVALAGPHIASATVASPSLLANGSFTCTTACDQFGLITASTSHDSNALTGWTITGAGVDIVPSTYWQASGGNYSVDLIGSPGLGGIFQDLTTTIGTTYTLTFEMSVNPENLTNEAADTKHLLVTATPIGASLSTDLHAALSPPPDATQTYDGTVGTRTKANMQYIQETFQFTASSTDTMLSLAATMPSGLPASFNANNVYCGPVIDNLVLIAGGTNPIPEPASLALLGAGSAMLLGRRSRPRS